MKAKKWLGRMVSLMLALCLTASFCTISASAAGQSALSTSEMMNKLVSLAWTNSFEENVLLANGMGFSAPDVKSADLETLDETLSNDFDNPLLIKSGQTKLGVLWSIDSSLSAEAGFNIMAPNYYQFSTNDESWICVYVIGIDHPVETMLLDENEEIVAFSHGEPYTSETSEYTLYFTCMLYPVESGTHTFYVHDSPDPFLPYEYRSYEAYFVSFESIPTWKVAQNIYELLNNEESTQPVSSTATPTSSTVLVNGVPTAFDAYNIGGANYFKLRDLAFVLNGTEKQFEVSWDAAANAISLISGQPYTAVGGEMTAGTGAAQTATPTSSKILLNGAEAALEAYNIGGNNYFKLRDIGSAFNFGVEWDGAANTVVIDTSKDYTA